MGALERLGINKLTIKSIQKKYSDSQIQTKNAFSFKWSKRESYDTPEFRKFTKEWLLQKYCNSNPKIIDDWLRGEPKIILDAGCGSSFSAVLLFNNHLKNNDYLGIDISTSIYEAKKRFKEIGCPGDFLQCNILDLPIDNNKIDVIFSEGVLHHTDSTENSIKYLANKLKKNGLFMFYVYRKKAVIREFTDDYIREKIKDLTDEEAWEALEPLTKLGVSLGKKNVQIEIQDDIPFLGIKKGKMDLQRFFYWNICKLFYRPEIDIEVMNHINFDWFRPLNCHRHTKEEVIAFCNNSSLQIENIHVEDSGITVVARKK